MKQQSQSHTSVFKNKLIKFANTSLNFHFGGSKQEINFKNALNDLTDTWWCLKNTSPLLVITSQDS